MRLVLTLGDLILFDVRLFERDEEQPETAPEVFSVGFCSTERATWTEPDRSAASEGVEWRGHRASAGLSRDAR